MPLTLKDIVTILGGGFIIWILASTFCDGEFSSLSDRKQYEVSSYTRGEEFAEPTTPLNGEDRDVGIDHFDVDSYAIFNDADNSITVGVGGEEMFRHTSTCEHLDIIAVMKNGEVVCEVPMEVYKRNVREVCNVLKRKSLR